MRVVVAAQDLVTAWGRGVDRCWRGVLGGRPAFSLVDRFDTSSMRAKIAALVPDLDPAAPDSLVMQMLNPLLRPLAGSLPAETLVVLATTTGEVDLLEKNLLTGRGAADDSRLDVLLGRITALLGVRDPGRLLSAACASSTAAVAHASSLIAGGARDCVLVVACDAVTEFIFAGFSTLMALDPDGARPFDRARKGLTAGEGAGYVLLMSEEYAARNGTRVLGEVAGWGLTCDAHHITGPSRDGEGLARAVRGALRMARMEADEIGCISAHGTGTVYNDSMEIKAYRQVFGDPPRPPVYSIKGGIGHTMGAAGLVEVVVALKSMEEGVVPPSSNLADVDPEAQGWVSPVAVDAAGLRTTLTTNSGFGGVNAALVLKGPLDRAQRSGTAVPGRAGFPLAENSSAAPEGKTPRQGQIVVSGVGWMDAAEWGCVRQGHREAYGGDLGMAPWERDDVFRTRVKNPARLDDATRVTLCACALALRDAGAGGGLVGLVGMSAEGCLQANRVYFADYLEAGRMLARGNLFVGTLPTSPLAQAAIHLGLKGPLLYLHSGGRVPDLLDAARRLMADDPALTMLAIDANPRAAVAFCLTRDEGQGIDVSGALGDSGDSVRERVQRME